jgi:regulator of protease activity HflC (stomatin/prohibitin superfamily)
LKANLNKQVAGFGIRVSRFEIKELRIPRAMQKLMARTKLHKLQLEHPLNRTIYKVDLENLGQFTPPHRINN